MSNVVPMGSARKRKALEIHGSVRHVGLSVVLKANNLAVHTECSQCDYDGRPDTPFAAFVEGTWDWVCPNCLQRIHALAGLWEALDAFNGLVSLVLSGSDPAPLYRHIVSAGYQGLYQPSSRDCSAFQTAEKSDEGRPSAVRKRDIPTHVTSAVDVGPTAPAHEPSTPGREHPQPSTTEEIPCD